MTEMTIQWRCAVTGNLSGTDTELIGQPCQCDACRAFREIGRLRAGLMKLDQMIFEDPQTIERAGEQRAHIWNTLYPQPR